MNSESINLSMTPQEADHVAHVLMAALQQPNFMLDSERKTAANAAKALFKQLGYGYTCDEHGERVEMLKPAAKRVSPECEHPGMFVEPGDKPEDVKHCSYCGRNVPVAQL